MEGFEAVYGRLPASLKEAGIDTPGLVYSVDSDGFSIASATEGSAVRLEQGQEVDGF